MIEPDWDGLRAHFDVMGLTSVEEVTKRGVPRELAGQRVAEFNDMVIKELQKKYRESSDVRPE